ncbi:MAG: Rrf2 family transcriptional regulator [Bacilli bacterium]|nr:Rrf2 family transcriptional regulator [Bacilli bacterium]
MKISTKGRYALSIMIQLGRVYSEGEYLSLTEISEREHISLKYLEKIMISLKKADFFLVQKGKEGGYLLKKDPSEISIGSIIRAAEEELDVVDCVKSGGCPKKNQCGTYPLWKGLSEEINLYLDSKFLKEYL